MQALRRATVLARLVLAWFALSLGVAVAAPLVKSGGFELVCSAGGALKLIAQDEPGGQPAKVHKLECPLCAGTAAAPPPVAPAVGRTVEFAAASFEVRVEAAPPRIAAAPLPARGPPAPIAL